MEKKILKIAIIAVLLVCVCSNIVNALSFTATMTPSSKVVPYSTEFTVEIKVSNLDVGTNGINALSGYLKYDENIFEKISESSIEGRNGWSHSYNAENDGKITLTKTSFVKTEEEVFQITLKTKSEEDLKNIEKAKQKGEIQFTKILASNSASEISAADISVEITIGDEETNSGNTTSNGTISVSPTNTNVNTNSNTNKTIGITPTNTNKNNTNTNTNTNTNKVTPYVNSTNTTKEDIPYTGVEDTIMYLIGAIIAIAIVFYIKFERINKEMK